jgi:hypothetical protein
MNALAEASNIAASVSVAANGQVESVNHGPRSRATAVVTSSASLIFSTAAAIDDRFALGDKAINAGTDVVSRAKKLDEQYNVNENVRSFASKWLERARGLDSRITGGKMEPRVSSVSEKALEVATGGLTYIQVGYETAKQQRQGNEKVNTEANISNEAVAATAN